MNTTRRCLFILMLFVANVSATSAATLVVGNNADSGAGSLRQAVTDATSGDTITFDSSLSGATITLTSGEMVLNKNLTLDGSGLAGGITLHGNNSSRIFNVTSGTSFALLNLTLSGGFGGAGGGDNGGAIINVGITTLTRCTLSGNSTGNAGGAIHNNNGGSLTLTQCTITNNTAPGGGGGISSWHVSSLVATYCTISGNSGGFGGGGVYNFQGPLTLVNSIVAGNTSSNDPNGADITNEGNATPTVTRVGANIIQHLVHNGNGTDSGPAAINANPLLAALASNGGPTKTMALLVGSPAINAAVGSSITGDQRGLSLYGAADLGAYEYKGGYFTVLNTNDSGAGSLRQALADAAVASGANTIDFHSILSGATITLTSALVISDTSGVTLDASALANGLTLDGNNACRIFNIGTASVLNLVALNITRGNGDGTPYNLGGAISNDGTLTASRCSFYDNHAAWWGGAINNASASAAIYLTSCTLTNNSAGQYGGGLAAYGSTAVLTHCTVSGNTAYAFGAAFGTVDYHYCIVSGNGGGIYADTGNPVGLNLIGGDAKLSALGNNGGPTKTMALLAGSPAINAAIGSTITSDQRGFAIIGTADLGAVEANILTVTTTADSGAGSLRQAVADAATISGATTVTFDAALSGTTITLASEITITDTDGVTIDGSTLPAGITLSGNSQVRVFVVSSGSIANLMP